jgi:hypothetical protein
MLVYKQTLLLVDKQEKKLQADCSEESPSSLKVFAVCTLVVGNESVSQGHFQFIAIIPCSHPGGQNIGWFVNI